MPVPTPTSELRHIRTSDFDEARAGLRRLYGEVRADVAGDFEWRAIAADLGPVLVVQGTCTAPAALDITPGVHVLSLPVHNRARLESPRGPVDMARGRCAGVISAGTRSVWRTDSDVRSVTIRLDTGFLQAQLESLAGVEVDGPLIFAPELRTDSGPGAPIERLMLFVVDEINSGTPLDHPVLVTSLQETLARALLLGQPHSHAHLLQRPPPAVGPAAVRRVEDHVDAHPGDPLTSADLTSLTGADARAVDAAFREHRHTSLAAFLRARRLEHARRLIAADPHVPAAHVVHASGFLRLEAFEAAYFQAFHERPEDTRRRAVASSASPPRAASDPRELAARLASLTPRELEVCTRVGRGMLNKQIAFDLDIAERTVREHRARGMKKLGVGSAAELGSLLVQVLQA